jgi:hypothetical protein
VARRFGGLATKQSAEFEPVERLAGKARTVVADSDVLAGKARWRAVRAGTLASKPSGPQTVHQCLPAKVETRSRRIVGLPARTFELS